MLGLLSRRGWHRAWFVITLCGGQGWVCYPAVQDRAGFVYPLSEHGWVCYPAARARLGLLSRCCSRAGFVIPLV